ncbi:spore coat protein [bacterium]|nr:spore coat protein [bacterium]
MKAVLLAGGKGTRLKPSTKIVNKHLLPVYSEQGAVPMIFYPISTLVRSGATEILIISSRDHSGSIIQNLGDGHDFGADFTYKIQDVNKVSLGIASALKLARNFTGDEPFAVILGDNFYEDSFEEQFHLFPQSCPRSARIFVKEVADPNRFGVYSEGYIEEKPESPKSNMAVTGLYLYHPGVYDIAEKLKPSGRGELEITDVNNAYCLSGAIDVSTIPGFWSDMGTPQSLKRTQDFIESKGYFI